jgi:tetratricopeptide (TPR) repeat protein
VATGSAFCGACGERRRQYCVIGLSVIRAARLAQKASGAPLVDEATYVQSVRRYDFLPAELLELKGLGPAVTAHQVAAPRTDLPGPERLIGRRREQLVVERALQQFGQSGDPSLLLIEGELGVGKTALLSQLVTSCRGLGLPCAIGVADEVEQHASFFAVRRVMQTLLGSLDEQRSALTELGELELLALLNPLTGSTFAESALVAGMAPETRAENRRRVTERLLERRLGERRWVAVIDDAHCIDASSCELIRYLSQHLRNLTWIVAGRPGRTEAASLATRFGRPVSLVLDVLEASEVAELVAASQGAVAVSSELGACITRLGRGNPLHSLELARELVVSRRLELASGTLRLTPGTSLELAEVPGTLEELIQSRFDRLPNATRVVLRAASVIGAAFDVGLLLSVLAADMQSSDVESALSAAVLEGLVQAREAHEFEHASIQAVIYGLLLPREQQLLHRRVAHALQELHQGAERAIAARLAHHWLRAKVPEKAAEFSGLAASQALEAYANADAVHLFTQALEQDQVQRGTLRLDVQRANWASGLGQALYSQSRHQDARAAYRRAMTWSEPSLIRSGASLPLSIAGYLGSVVLPEKLGVRIDTASPQVQEHYVAAMRASAACGALDVWEGRLLEAASRSFRARRLAQRVSGSPESAEVIAGLGYLLGATPARARGEQELQTAIRISDSLGDLQSKVTTRVFYGMFLTMVGRTRAAEEPLSVAQTAAERLGSGLWRHRASFGLGEALFFEAKFPEAADAFAKAAAIASEAEPPVEGFANALCALARARIGRLDEALELVLGPRGFALAQRDGLILQRFASLGVAAELLLRSGQEREALKMAERAFALCESDPRADVFFAGIHGYAGITAVFLRALHPGSRMAADRKLIGKRLGLTLRRLRAFARMYPAAAPCVDTLVARRELATGAARDARAGFARASSAAATLDQPYFEFVARRWLAECEGGERGVPAARRASALATRFDLHFSVEAGG